MQYVTLEDTVYLYFGSNNTSGSGDDGASATFDVREGGAASNAAPTLSGNATLLSHANYPAGCYEVAIDATAANGFSASKTYGVFSTLAVDSQNPTGFIGAFRTGMNASVGSVTGAVGSVTGNVGGNVAGSVASVTGAVGSVTGNVGGNVAGSVASVTGNVGGNVVGSVGSVTVVSDKTGYALTSAYDFAKGTVAMTEGYRSAGAAPTPEQAFFEIIAHMGESSISGTTKTLKKLDGSTTAKTYTLDDDTAPTSITETT